MVIVLFIVIFFYGLVAMVFLRCKVSGLLPEAERYALIGGRRPSVERTEFVYTVRLPIISGLDNDREI